MLNVRDVLRYHPKRSKHHATPSIRPNVAASFQKARAGGIKDYEDTATRLLMALERDVKQQEGTAVESSESLQRTEVDLRDKALPVAEGCRFT